MTIMTILGVDEKRKGRQTGYKRLSPEQALGLGAPLTIRVTIIVRENAVVVAHWQARIGHNLLAQTVAALYPPRGSGITDQNGAPIRLLTLPLVANMANRAI